jgi:hypothetical protein
VSDGSGWRVVTAKKINGKEGEMKPSRELGKEEQTVHQ